MTYRIKVVKLIVLCGLKSKTFLCGGFFLMLKVWQFSKLFFFYVKSTKEPTLQCKIIGQRVKVNKCLYMSRCPRFESN